MLLKGDATMVKTRNYDMTQGNPTKILLQFAVPMLVGNIFQQLYNMVDSAIVGRFVGENALAAVGATGSIVWLFFSLVYGLASGAGVIVSQYYGAKEEKKVKQTIATAAYIMITTSILMCLITFFTARPVMLLLNTPADVIGNSVIYLKVVAIGILAVGPYNGVASILRAIGDSKLPLIFMVIGCVTNIGLDLLFVIVFGWGVFGVAFATVIAQMIAMIGLVICSWLCRPIFRLQIKEYVVNKDIFCKCFALGVPMALQSSLIAVSCTVLQAVVNSYGPTIMAAYTVACRFEQIVQQVYDSLGMGIGTYTGQNMGANNIERVKKGFWSGVKLNVLFSLCMIPITFFGGKVIMSIFTDNPAVIYEGARGIRINCFFYMALGMIYVGRSLLNSAGDVKFTMIAGIVEVICRVGFAKPLTYVPFIGMLSIWFTSGLTWLVTGTVTCMRYASGKWKAKGIIQRQHADERVVGAQ